MIGFLSGLWGKAAGIGLLVLGILGAYLRMRAQDRAGAKAEVEARHSKQALEIKDAQQKAAAAAPRDRDSLADELRDGKF